MNTVRILPMNHQEEDFVGKTIEEIQKEFFCKTMLEEKGWYNFRTSGLVAEDGDLVLFQMDSQIIASAAFKDCFHTAGDNEWRGSLVFHCNSIKIFKPISSNELKEYIPDFVRFNDCKPSLELTDEQYNKLIERINIGL